MPSKNYANVKAGWSQQDQRGERTFYDQHKSAKFPQGRPWWGWCERPAEGAAMPMPVGELIPLGWNAPWLPDAMYINKSIGKATPGATMQEHKFRIDYNEMIQDRKRALKQYYDRAVNEAIGQGWEAPNYGDVISYRLRAIIGAPPLSPKIPEAAQAEDPWILGFSNVENEELARLLALGTGSEHIETADQGEKRADTVADLKAQVAQLAELVKAREAADAAKAQAAKDRMAKARAGRKTSQASTG